MSNRNVWYKHRERASRARHESKVAEEMKQVIEELNKRGTKK